MKTPCQQICRIVNNVCIGCNRTLDQIANWTNYTDQQRRKIMDTITYDILTEDSKHKVNVWDIGGELVKENETYKLRDNTKLNNLVLSSTELKPGRSTRGHKHDEQEEVYHFITGYGEMELNDDKFKVKGGDIIMIPAGVFHRVHNSSKHSALYFVCVFEGKRNH